jgi:hypothetical protein
LETKINGNERSAGEKVKLSYKNVAPDRETVLGFAGDHCELGRHKTPLRL